MTKSEIEIPKTDETKDLLIEFYQRHRGESVYPDDAACELGLDLKVTMQAVKELIREGRIEEVNDPRLKFGVSAAPAPRRVS